MRKTGLFFLLSFLFALILNGLILGQLWVRTERQTRLEAQTERLKIIYGEREEDFLERQRLSQSWTGVKASGFLKPLNQEVLLKRFKQVALSYGVKITQFYFGKPVIDQQNQTVTLKYSPISLQMKARNEAPIYQALRSFQNQGQGTLFPTLLKMTQSGPNQFVVDYAFFHIQGL